jgi:cytochrome c-type biogenesis protein CcmH/NrfF
MWVLAWTLTGPVVAVVLAMVWMWWRTRPRRPADTAESVAEYERFRAALAGEEHRRRRR